GPQALSVTFTPTDTDHYVPVTKSVSILVNPATPVVLITPETFSFGSHLPATASGTATWVVGGNTVSVPGTFRYASAGAQLTQAGANVETVTFTPDDTTDYNSIDDTR